MHVLGRGTSPGAPQAFGGWRLSAPWSEYPPGSLDELGAGMRVQQQFVVRRWAERLRTVRLSWIWKIMVHAVSTKTEGTSIGKLKAYAGILPTST